MEIPFLLLYAASWVTITGGIWLLFERAEVVVTPETKAAISRWLRNLDPTTAFPNWPATFAAVFDRIFGERHLSWRCFRRSCAASFISVVIVTLFWAALRPHQFTMFVKDENYIFLVLIFVMACVLNLIPDYLSLLESRHIIRWMSRRRSIVRIFALLAVDLLISAAIISVAFFYWLAPILFKSGDPVFNSFLSVLLHLLLLSSLSEGLPSFGICFYSTFFTSVWVWVYALSGLVVRLGQYLGISLRGLKMILDLDKKPLRSMGLVAMLLVTLLYLVAAPFLL